MFTACHPLLLASASPRRQEFFSQLGLKFAIQPADIDETPLADELPQDFARRMALSKAELIALSHPKACVIAADTVVALDQTLFGKPRDRNDALVTLKTLQGRTHTVITGFAVLCSRLHLTEIQTVTTHVTFATHADAILQAYIDSGEPMDKAGAYGIQGRGALLVQRIHGSHSNVIGLPVSDLVQVLLRHGLIVPRT